MTQQSCKIGVSGSAQTPPTLADLYERIDVSKGICSVGDCERLAYGRGWCRLHYERWRKHGDPLKTGKMSRVGTCRVDGCDGPIQSLRLCAVHYSRMWKHGSVELCSRPPIACAVEGCDSNRAVRDWCREHHDRWRFHGDASWVPLTREQLFWTKVDKNGPIPAHRPSLGPCFIWTKRLDKDGYGAYSQTPGLYRAHQFAYVLAFGPVPDGLEIDHLCHVRVCVNSAHLEAVTHEENLARRRDRLA